MKTYYTKYIYRSDNPAYKQFYKNNKPEICGLEIEDDEEIEEEIGQLIIRALKLGLTLTFLDIHEIKNDTKEEAK